MNINDAFPSKYIKHSDLKGQPRTLTMSHVALEKFSGGDEGVILHFSDATKGLVLKPTNKNAIVKAYGQETNGWKGKPLELYPAMTEFKGEMTECVRVRAPEDPLAAPQPQQPAPSPAIAPDPAPAGEPEDPFGNGPMGEQGGEDLPF
jgi:hypothetical protein